MGRLGVRPAQEKCIEAALARAGFEPARVDYLATLGGQSIDPSARQPITDAGARGGRRTAGRRW